MPTIHDANTDIDELSEVELQLKYRDKLVRMTQPSGLEVIGFVRQIGNHHAYPSLVFINIGPNRQDPLLERPIEGYWFAYARIEFAGGD